MTSTRFKPGKSGNPRGRPPGTGEVGKLRASIADHVPSIITALVGKAKEGDASAARLLLERVLPPLKALDPAVSLTLPDGSLTDQAKTVITAMAGGALPPTQAAQILAGIASMAKLMETDELAARIAALEAKHGNRT